MAGKPVGMASSTEAAKVEGRKTFL